MVQRKGHKSRPKLQANAKTRDDGKLNAQLGVIGLKIVHITADGNCLFRAVADQLEGNEDEHPKYRNMVVDFIEAHREDYEPFLEDEVPFDEYCKNMRETSTWAGHMELQVISLVTHTNICIHRILSPRWHIQNYKSIEAHCIHLSYHNGEHYNSIRRIDDNGEGPAKPIMLEDRVERQKFPSKHAASVKKQSTFTEKESFQEKGCDDLDEGDAEEQFQMDCCTNGKGEDRHNGGLMQDYQDLASMEVAFPNKEEQDATSDRPLQRVQKVSRNKACPCGSKKKYKACCGIAMPRNSSQEIMCSSTEGLSNKARKEKLRNSKDTTKAKTETSLKDSLLDLGYLCI